MKRMMFIEMDFPDGLPEQVVSSNLEALSNVFESVIDLTGFSTNTVLYTPDSDASADMRNLFGLAAQHVNATKVLNDTHARAMLFVDDMCTVFEWPKDESGE
jgi:hypothetical protein